MEVHDFATARELVQYTIDNGVGAAAIVQILESDGRWYIFHT